MQSLIFSKELLLISILFFGLSYLLNFSSIFWKLFSFLLFLLLSLLLLKFKYDDSLEKKFEKVNKKLYETNKYNERLEKNLKKQNNKIIECQNNINQLKKKYNKCINTIEELKGKNKILKEENTKEYTKENYNNYHNFKSCENIHSRNMNPVQTIMALNYITSKKNFLTGLKNQGQAPFINPVI